MWISITAVGRRQAPSIFFSPSFLSSTKPEIRNEQKRTIFSKFAQPDYDKHRPPPWPYKERGFTMLHQWIDFGVNKRLGENSKLIIVEGNVGSGKSKFAKELADSLGFYYIEDPNYDNLLIDSYGDDQRLYYHLLPETCRLLDTRMFYEQPRHRNVAMFQKRRFFYRVEAYLNALAHLLNTGQGVVLERCPHTDRVFLEAMYKRGYVTDRFRYYYYKVMCKHVFDRLKLEAHCVVYLDCPVSKCLENIKKNHKPWEWQNEVMDYDYLEHMDRGLKHWMKEYQRHAEILTYDASEGVDAQTVAEDLEDVDLDSFLTYKNDKFETWYLMPDELRFTQFRSMVTSDKYQVMETMNYADPSVEELFVPMGDQQIRVLMLNLLYGPYKTGFRKERGDDVADMVLSPPWRHPITNKVWSEYCMQDEHHLVHFDLGLYHPWKLVTPSFPEEWMQPRSPYKSDGGCMADAHLFFDANGYLLGKH